jgi:hypothetical protein
VPSTARVRGQVPRPCRRRGNEAVAVEPAGTRSGYREAGRRSDPCTVPTATAVRWPFGPRLEGDALRLRRLRRHGSD